MCCYEDLLICTGINGSLILVNRIIESFLKSLLWRSSGRKSSFVEEEEVNSLSSSCYICGRHFSFRKNFLPHRRIHMGEQYDCLICGKIYSRKDKLKAHIRKKHSLENE